MVAVCDDAAAGMVGTAWSGVELVRIEAPTAADAIRVCLPRILAGEFEDLALLDGHYLRRSDAEIFGGAPQKRVSVSGRGIRVRKMEAEDIDRVMLIVSATHHAPVWPRGAYETGLNPDMRPRRIALVAEEGQSGELVGFVIASLLPPEAELETVATALSHQRHGVARELFTSLKKELRRVEVREVVLEVRAGNKAAQGFYRFLGFAEEGRRPAYYADPVEDAILMRLGLR
jgi:ribosomal-protein-alanine acetyltransferase